MPTRAVTAKAIFGNRAAATKHREISSQMREYFNCSTRRFTAWMTTTMATRASTISFGPQDPAHFFFLPFCRLAQTTATLTLII